MLKKIFAFFIACSIFYTLLPMSYASDLDCVIYVSNNGNAEGDGSENNPFGSIVLAQQKVRELIKENNKRNITVYVRDGVYNILEYISFDERDSVADGYTLTFKGYQDENVVFVSGIKLNSEKAELVKDKEIINRLPNIAKGKVWVYDISESGLTREDYGEMEYRGPYSNSNPAVPKNDKAVILSYNGERMTVARYPNTGFLHVSEIIQSCPATFSSEADYYNGIILPFPESRCARWVTAKDAVIFGTLYYDWGAASAELSKVDIRKRTITSKQAFRYGIRSYSPTGEGGKYYVYNLMEEIDLPGEYYIDRENNKFYFYPMDDNPSEADITIGYKKNIIYGKNAKNITFENLKFEGARGDAVKFENSDNILFNKCQIKNSSSSISFEGGHNCGVVNSVICDVNSGIKLGGTAAQREILEETGHYAINNHIYNWGIVDHRYASAATMNGVGNIFAKNKVHGAEHQAIQPAGINNVVEYNEFFDTNREVGDSGCLYEGQNYAKRGNVYRYNYFHDIGPEDKSKFVNSIYLDDSQSGTVIYGNIFRNASNAVFFHQGMSNKVFNNIFIDCSSDYRWTTSTNTAEKSVVGGSRYTQSMVDIASDNEIWKKVFPDLFANGFSDSNFFYYVHGNEGYDNININTPEGDIPEQCLVNSSRENGTIFVLEEAGFEDYANENYTLKADSAIFKVYPEFKYDFANIGYEEEGLSIEEIEQYKSHMIKIDSSYESIREKIQNESIGKEILVLKGDDKVYFAEGQYKLYSTSEAITPIYNNGTLMLPVQCAIALGMSVNENEDSVNITYKETTTECNYKYINGEVAIPLRECFEKLGFVVIWNETKNVIIYNKSLSFDDEVIKHFAEKL